MSYPQTSQRDVAQSLLEQFKAVSEERKRAKVYVKLQGVSQMVDVTEDVVSLLDMITSSMDWGSDFWCDGDLPSFIKLCDLLKVDIES